MTKILLLVGIIPPFTCKDSFSKQMLEYYLLKAKDSLPDLEWQIKEIEEENKDEMESNNLKRV